VEDNIVVSEIGEQWSPNTDPDKTEANVAKNMGDSTVASGDIFKRCIAIGTTTGTNIDMVAQDEPVEKLMAAAVTKVMKGSMAGDKILEEILTKYSAVFTVSAKASPVRNRPKIDMILNHFINFIAGKLIREYLNPNR
jgi:hypothetical protein|tara:strand:+ start:440 stop:853 length:414 start_codon:yes stop_codon:yes gene_type:complete